MQERVEDCAVLRGQFCEEWHAAYERLLIHVFQRMRKVTSEDWREWERLREQVQSEVRACVRELEGQ